jgi:hypothetical protein
MRRKRAPLLEKYSSQRYKAEKHNISARSIAISLKIGFKDEMHRIFLHPDLIGRILIGMTNARGGHDNVSVSLLTHIG